jgi:hypothetical protein
VDAQNILQIVLDTVSARCKDGVSKQHGDANMNNVHPIFQNIFESFGMVPAPKLDVMGYQQRVRVGNMNRERLTRELANDIAERDALPEGKRRDNVTWRISLRDEELQSWIDLVNDAQAHLDAISLKAAE